MTNETTRGLDVSPPVRVRQRARAPEPVEMPERPATLTRPALGARLPYVDPAAVDIPSPQDRAARMIEAARNAPSLPDDDDELGRQLSEGFEGIDTSDMRPNEKMRALYRAHGPKEAKRYIFQLLNQLKQRHTPNDQIARIFDVTVRTVQIWNKELKQLVSDDVARLDLNQFIGDSMLLYSEVTRMALSECAGQITPGQKANYMRIAAYAQGRKDALLLGYGVTAQKRYRPEENDKGTQDTNDILSMIKNSIDGVFIVQDNLDVEEQSLSILR